MCDSRLARLIAVALIALVACSRGANSQQPAAASHTTASSARPKPAETTPTPVPSTSAPSPAPALTPERTGGQLPPAPKHVLRLAPEAAPQILDVAMTETTVHPGDRVFGRVVTTSNVASVEARIGGYAVSLVKTGVGRFELTYTVGPLPWFIRGNFMMQVIARNTRGDVVTRAIPLTVR